VLSFILLKYSCFACCFHVPTTSLIYFELLCFLNIYVGILIFFFFSQEYLEDGIDWATVDFVDNTDCLSLFEKVRNLFTYGP
jgi:hypothetical protein